MVSVGTAAFVAFFRGFGVAAGSGIRSTRFADCTPEEEMESTCRMSSLEPAHSTAYQKIVEQGQKRSESGGCRTETGAVACSMCVDMLTEGGGRVEYDIQGAPKRRVWVRAEDSAIGGVEESVHIDISTYRHIDISTYRHIDIDSTVICTCTEDT